MIRHHEGVTTRAELRADCAQCFALCCVGPLFTRSSEFAIDKPAGRPCPHLADDHHCSIHDRLQDEGFSGCAAYDCFGAGQRLAQRTFGGRDWRTHREVAAPLMAALVCGAKLVAIHVATGTAVGLRRGPGSWELELVVPPRVGAAP